MSGMRRVCNSRDPLLGNRDDALAQKIALRYAATFSAQKLKKVAEEALVLLNLVKGWGAKFPTMLAKARKTDLPTGWVWQDDLIEYFSMWEMLLSDLRLSERALSNLSFDDQELSDLANLALAAVYEPPRKARPDFAMGTFDFFKDPEASEDNIAYKVQKLKEWHRNFGQWVGSGIQNLRGVLKKVGEKT
jgi:hypothetical protein